MLENEELLFFMLEKYGETFGKIVNSVDGKGRSALHYLALNLTKFKEAFKLIEMMLEKGGDFQVKDDLGINSFLAICLSKYADPPQQNNNQNRFGRAIQRANLVHCNNAENTNSSILILDLFLKNISPNLIPHFLSFSSSDQRGFTPLHAACFTLNLPLVQYLLEKSKIYFFNFLYFLFSNFFFNLKKRILIVSTNWVKKKFLI
jgi:ankyrin repeat protein